MLGTIAITVAFMQQSNSTAVMAAAARAAHLLVDRPPFIFSDPWAKALLGARGEKLIGYHRSHGDHPILAGTRVAVTVRSRYAEEKLSAAARRGVDQYVIFGAGLDSFAYRTAPKTDLRIFEVDHPAAQEAKLQTISAAGLPDPGPLIHVPVDFEAPAPTLGEALTGAGLDYQKPTFASWLGVTMYLTRDAIEGTLSELSRLPLGSELVMDYVVPAELRDEEGACYAEMAMAASGERGESWRTFFTPEEISEMLTRHGFTTVEQLPHRKALHQELWSRDDALRPYTLFHLTWSRRTS
jgi:methyltransferase (TIGR00027 family)